MKILVTGGTGMVGNAIKRNITGHDVVYIGRRNSCNMSKPEEVKDLFEWCNPDVVIHLAARVGGIKDNSDFVYDYFCENLKINTNVIDQCAKFCIKNVIALSSTCVYPKIVQEYPIKEEVLHNGYPEETNFGYAFAKRMMQVQINAARKQDREKRIANGYKWSILYPSNLYGPFDTFDLQKSHVIPALILKLHQAKIDKKDEVEIYGTGKPLRQLTYVDDLAKQIIKMIDQNSDDEFNFANPRNYSIAEIAKEVGTVVGFEGKIKYNGRLDGVMRKDVSIEKISSAYQLEPFTELNNGLTKTYEWFLANKGTL